MIITVILLVALFAVSLNFRIARTQYAAWLRQLAEKLTPKS